MTGGQFILSLFTFGFIAFVGAAAFLTAIEIWLDPRDDEADTGDPDKEEP